MPAGVYLKAIALMGRQIDGCCCGNLSVFPEISEAAQRSVGSLTLTRGNNGGCI